MNSARPMVAVGDEITASGRRFTAVAIELYPLRDGGQGRLVTWRGCCATCLEPYEVKGSGRAAYLPINCVEHRGRRTRHSKKRRKSKRKIESATDRLRRAQPDRAGIPETRNTGERNRWLAFSNMTGRQ